MGSTSVRVRFAPSPTGHLHIGGLRTALFNYLFARHYKGSFLIRIEDTDRERSEQQYVDSILNSFSWVNIEPDEPIVIQSHRIEEHNRVLAQLLADGKAYRCYCTPEEIVARNKERLGADYLYAGYDRRCRTMIPSDINKVSVIRFAVPPEITSVTFNDLIRGPLVFGHDQLDDFIIARSDGNPVYNFVVVIDDAFMRISHVIRAEEHISNTPKQILLYQACGFTVPQFAHIPMILGPSGEKLSKRDGATSVLEYKEQGFLPDALINYLSRLGWSHGDQEIFSREELIEYFTLDHVGKKGAIFDPEKLQWVNSVYMRDADPAVLLSSMHQSFLEQVPLWHEQTLSSLINLYKSRTKTLKELSFVLLSLYKEPQQFSEADIAQWTDASTPGYLVSLIQRLEQLSSFTVETVTEAVKALCAQEQIKLVALAQPIRLAFVGHTASPGVFELMTLLGKKESIARLQRLHAFLVQRL